MSKKPEATNASIKLVRLLLLVATGLAGYLAFNALTGATVAGCGEEQGCGKVLTSKWASILTVPVSIPGIVMYLSLLFVSFKAPFSQKNIAALISFLSVAIIAGALWFTLLQMLIIKEYCYYCCATHFIASLASVLMLKNLKQKKASNKLNPSKDSSAKGIALASIFAILSVGGTILLQTFGPEKDHSKVVNLTNNDNSKTATSETTQLISVYRSSPKQRLRVTLVGGKYNAPVSYFPTITLGASSESSKANDPIQLIYLFDWTCDYCREFHQKMDELSTDASSLGLDSQYQITLLPASYNKEGDTLHQVMLSAYFGAREAFNTITKELYDGTLPAQTNSVRDRAIELVGAQKWQKVIQRSTYRANQAKAISELQIAHNEQHTKASTFPQLVSKSSIIMGLPTDAKLKEFLLQAKREQYAILAAPDFGKVKPITYKKKNAPKPKAPLPVRNNSKIEFTSATVTTDPILPGSKATGTFQFKNTGTDPLEIFNLKTGCGCTYSKGWKQTVPPGESGEFTVTYNSRGKSPYGTHTRSIWVTSSAANYDKSTSQGERYGNQVKLLVPMKNKDGSLAVRPQNNKVKKIVPVGGAKPAPAE